MKIQLSVFAIIIMAFATIAASPVRENVKIIPEKVKQVSDQTYTGFDFFRLHRQTKDGATVTWGMTSESGVSGYAIERTYLDPTDPYGWENAGYMACSSSRSYKWTDVHIFPGFISYRIVALMNNGSSITSEVLTIHIISH